MFFDSKINCKLSFKKTTKTQKLGTLKLSILKTFKLFNSINAAHSTKQIPEN